MLEKIKAKLSALREDLEKWLNVAFLAALPVYEVFKDSLPDLQAYLPDNIYKCVGIAVVLINIILLSRKKKGA